MGVVEKQRPVKLVTSLIYRETRSMEKAEKGLKNTYGSLGGLEMDIPFDFTDYYREEFGYPLRRKLICFKALVGKETLNDIKHLTNKMEENLSVAGKRTVNIDPGYVTEAKLVLLTTKDYTHRVYVGKGIFAESTLYFKDGAFRAWPWTYPDYSSEEMRSFFDRVRDAYVEDIKRGSCVH